MFIIKRFQKEKIVKFVVSFLLCVLFLLSSLSVFADEELTAATQSTTVSEQQTELQSEQITDVVTQPTVSTQPMTASEQQTELPSEQITDFISLTDSFTSSDYQLITVILLLVLIFVFLLKFIL